MSDFHFFLTLLTSLYRLLSSNAITFLPNGVFDSLENVECLLVKQPPHGYKRRVLITSEFESGFFKKKMSSQAYFPYPLNTRFQIQDATALGRSRK